VGNGVQVRIGVDPWIGCKTMVIFPDEIIDILHEKGLFILYEVADQTSTNLWFQ